MFILNFYIFSRDRIAHCHETQYTCLAVLEDTRWNNNVVARALLFELGYLEMLAYTISP